MAGDCTGRNGEKGKNGEKGRNGNQDNIDRIGNRILGNSGVVWSGWSGKVEPGMGWIEWNEMDRVEWDGQSGMGWMESRMGWWGGKNIRNGLGKNMVYNSMLGRVQGKEAILYPLQALTFNLC